MTTKYIPTTEERAAVADIIRNQIERGVFMTLGATNLGHTSTEMDRGYSMCALVFVARILPFKKNGKRSERAKKMAVEIALTANDTYDIHVFHMVRGERVTHFKREDVYVFDLNATLIALDYDGDEVLNPRYAA